MPEQVCTSDITCEIPSHIIWTRTGGLDWSGEPYFKQVHIGLLSDLCSKCGNYFDSAAHEFGCSDEG